MGRDVMKCNKVSSSSSSVVLNGVGGGEFALCRIFSFWLYYSELIFLFCSLLVHSNLLF